MVTRTKTRTRRLPAPAKTDSAARVDAVPDAPIVIDSADVSMDNAPVYVDEVLSDEYKVPDMGREMLFEAKPGFHISPWKNDDDGRTKMSLEDVRPLKETDSRLMPYERVRVRVGEDGFLCHGEYILGIETEEHYRKRYKVNISDKARNLTRNMPADPNVEDGVTETVHYATIQVVAPVRKD